MGVLLFVGWFSGNIYAGTFGSAGGSDVTVGLSGINISIIS